MSDKVILSGDTFSQCYGRIVHFACNISCVLVLSTVKSFEKMYPVLRHGYNQL